MTTISTSVGDIAAIEARPSQPGLLKLYLALTKARLSALVLVTTAVGYLLASTGPLDWARLLYTVIGTALAAGCASSFNQIIEIDLDRRMHRTRSRPLPSGSMTLAHSFAAAMFMGIAGLVILVSKVNLAAAWLALATILIYALLYTPMKVRTSLNTLVGAVCGAIPPMIGWVAVHNTLEIGAWILAGILFVWQIPHFFALAWLYREDYERGGFAMLPVIDRKGQITCQVIVLTSLMLLPLALLATVFNVSGTAYAIGSVIAGLWMLALCVRLYFHRTNSNARGVFLASIIYLPALLGLMVIDRPPHKNWTQGHSAISTKSAPRSLQSDVLSLAPRDR